jgi:hypothetical protein
MEQHNKPVALSSADARHLINQWSAEGFFRVRGLGGKIAVEDVVPCSSYTVRLKSEFEDRSVGEQTVPFEGGPVDSHGRPPDPWDMHARRPADFEDRTETMPVPHTEHVRPCPRCDSSGRTTCGTCQGFGQVNCTFCNGTGFRTRTEMRQERDAFGNMVMKPVQVRDNCTCFAGKVGCGTCGGQGTVVCGDCRGHGRIKTFEQLTVHFRIDSQTEVVHETRIPDHLLTQVRGEVLVDERGTPAVEAPRVDSRVDHHAEKLLRQSQSAPEGKTRLLFQHLHIEYVGIQEVRYRYHHSPLKSLWIYGAEQRIYAPGAPRPWFKVAAIVLGCAAAVGALIAVVAGFH